jgi:hypothetical protein
LAKVRAAVLNFSGSAIVIPGAPESSMEMHDLLRAHHRAETAAAVARILLSGS